MRNGWIFAVTLALGVCVPAYAEEPYKVQGGDTLWGISGKFYSSPPKWPVLWSKNPQIHNPHWINPGDPIYQSGKSAEAAGEEEVRIPLYVLTPPPPPEAKAPAAPAGEKKDAEVKKDGSAAAAMNGAKDKSGAAPGREEMGIEISGGRILDYVSPAKVERLGSVRAIVKKNAYGQYEEVFVDPAAENKIAAGDMLAIFDDSREISHPLDNSFAGYHVRMVGAAEVLSVVDGVAKAKIIVSNDTISEGQGVVVFAPPPKTISPAAARPELGGVVLAGSETGTAFAADQVVFLDKGSAQGSAPGAVVAIPFDEGTTDAEGMVADTDKPLAILMVLSAQENSSTAYVLNSRYTVVAGQKFAAASNSP